jgi:hypothetical protein
MTTVALVGACVVLLARTASAQAFVPEAGGGSITIAYQNLFARGHLDLNGDRMPGPSGTDPTRGHALIVEAEFGLTERLAVNASLPYIASRYDGSTPHLVGGSGPPQEWDDGTYHATFQDFHVGVRFNVMARPVAVTAFAERIIPSHHYPSLAHAAVGKDLLALTVGGAAGGFLDAVLPGLFFQTQYSYTRTEEVIGIRPNRSRVDAEVGYFITPRFAVRFLESYQVTHHGFDLISFDMTEAEIHGHPEIEFLPSYRKYHDQLQRSNFLNLGGGIGFALNDSIEIFVAGSNTVWGESVHPLRGVTIGVTTHFNIRKSHAP